MFYCKGDVIEATYSEKASKLEFCFIRDVNPIEHLCDNKIIFCEEATTRQEDVFSDSDIAILTSIVVFDECHESGADAETLKVVIDIESAEFILITFFEDGDTCDLLTDNGDIGFTIRRREF